MLNETRKAEGSAPDMGLKSMVYAVDVGGLPTVAFKAMSLAKARTLSRELWFRVDVASVKAGGTPLWDGEADLAVRPATADEMNSFWLTAEATEQPFEALAYLLAIDPVQPGDTTMSDDKKFDPAPHDEHAADPKEAQKADKKMHDKLDKGLDGTFPASDPVSSTQPSKPGGDKG